MKIAHDQGRWAYRATGKPLLAGLCAIFPAPSRDPGARLGLGGGGGREYRSRWAAFGPNVIAMFGTAGVVRPAGFLLLGPAAVRLASTRHCDLPVQPNRLAVLAVQSNRLDTGARG
ncbi:hypothetical protein Pen02_50300 [Plantactinospora endophytica]|uniref:Uncharacterized protein n=1 Tax=Plantactinospora endophytica TaxID=673535 RepID=A0ABQ4E5Y3_9ACTN|nr:hypothetical protein Pen02_50300 [Plantactinospora endophytica]